MGIPACPGKMDVKQDFSRKRRIRWMDGGGQAIGTTVQLSGACMDKLREMVYDNGKEG